MAAALDTTPARETSVPSAAWYGLAVLLITTLFAFVVRQMLNLIAPSLQTSLGLSDVEIGLLQGLGLAIFGSVASYPMGWLADRFGRRLLLAIGVGCWSAATLLCAFQHSFGGLLVGTIGIAIGEAGLAPIIYAIIPDLFPERMRNTANFIFYAGSMFGAGLGMALGGALLQWLAANMTALPQAISGIDGWRIAMAAIALPGPIFALLVMTLPKPAVRPAAADAPTSTRDFLPYACAHWRTLVCVFGSIFAMGVAMTSALIWFPLALPRAFAIDPTSVGVGLGTAITLATLIGIVLPPLILRLRRRSDENEVVSVAGMFVALTPVAALLLPLAGSPEQAYAVAAFQGAMGIAGSALMPGVLQNLAPPHLRSRVLALLGVANALALALSPILVGLVSSHLHEARGVLHAITIVSVPALTIAAVLLWLGRTPYSLTVRTLGAQVAGTAS